MILGNHACAPGWSGHGVLDAVASCGEAIRHRSSHRIQPPSNFAASSSHDRESVLGDVLRLLPARLRVNNGAENSRDEDEEITHVNLHLLVRFSECRTNPRTRKVLLPSMRVLSRPTHGWGFSSR